MLVKKEAIHKFIECDDGRLYHPTIAEKAKEAWEARQDHRRRLEIARAAKAAKRGSVIGSVTEPVATSLTEPVTGLKGREGKGREVKKDNPEIVDNSLVGLVASPTAPRKAKRAKARTQIAEDAQPDEKDRIIADEHGLSAELYRSEWRKFRSCHVAKGSLFANWHEAWRNWCEKIPEFQRQAPRAGPRQGGSGLAQISLEMATENHVKRQENPIDSSVLRLPGISEPEPGGHRNLDSLISASFKRI
jgi:hypothetical protein